MAITVGKKAPTFTLTDKDGTPHTLGEGSPDYTLVYFYPKDDTPGCTIEAQEFSGQLESFQGLNTRVIGISGNDDASKKKFCDKHHLKITLLSDPEFKVASEYGAYGKKDFMGRSYMGVFRKSFLLDSNLQIVKVYPDVTAKGHAEEVLVDIRALRSRELGSVEAVPAAAIEPLKKAKPTKTKVKGRAKKRKPTAKRGGGKAAKPASRVTHPKAKSKKAVSKGKTARRQKR